MWQDGHTADAIATYQQFVRDEAAMRAADAARVAAAVADQRRLPSAGTAATQAQV